MISPTREGLILTKLRICEVLRKLNSRENLRIYRRFRFVVWFLVSSSCWRNGVGGGCLGYVHAVVWQSVLPLFLAVPRVGLRSEVWGIFVTIIWFQILRLSVGTLYLVLLPACYLGPLSPLPVKRHLLIVIIRVLIGFICRLRLHFRFI